MSAHFVLLTKKPASEWHVDCPCYPQYSYSAEMHPDRISRVLLAGLEVQGVRLADAQAEHELKFRCALYTNFEFCGRSYSSVWGSSGGTRNDFEKLFFTMGRQPLLNLGVQTRDRAQAVLEQAEGVLPVSQLLGAISLTEATGRAFEGSLFFLIWRPFFRASLLFNDGSAMSDINGVYSSKSPDFSFAVSLFTGAGAASARPDRDIFLHIRKGMPRCRAVPEVTVVRMTLGILKTRNFRTVEEDADRVLALVSFSRGDPGIFFQNVAIEPMRRADFSLNSHCPVFFYKGPSSSKEKEMIVNEAEEIEDKDPPRKKRRGK